MRLQEIGHKIRDARKARQMTQAALARAAGVSRVTVNQLESGLFPDLGVGKLRKILEQVGLTLSIHPVTRERRPDFVSMAATSASVSFREKLTEEELIRSLLTGKVPPGRRPHLRTLLDEVASPVMQGLIEETNRWTRPDRVRRNLAAIAEAVGASRRVESWLPTH